MNSRSELFTSFSNIADHYESFIFDCDGVLWSGKDKFEEAFKTLEYLKSKRKNIFFLTNGSAKSRDVLHKKISDLGFECKAEDVYPSSYIAIAYLKLNEPAIKKIYVVGRDGIVTEAKKAGLEVVGGPADDDKEIADEEAFGELKVQNVDSIIVGLDMHFNYYKLAYASLCLQNGAKFYATNDDAYDVLGDRKLPAAGCQIWAIEKATHLNATVLGKPNKYAFDVIAEEHKFDKTKCLMIGDRLDTDITFGRNSGIDSCLVMTGATTDEILKKEFEQENPVIPTYIVQNLSLN